MAGLARGSFGDWEYERHQERTLKTSWSAFWQENKQLILEKVLLSKVVPVWSVKSAVLTFRPFVALKIGLPNLIW